MSALTITSIACCSPWCCLAPSTSPGTFAICWQVSPSSSPRQAIPLRSLRLPKNSSIMFLEAANVDLRCILRSRQAADEYLTFYFSLNEFLQATNSSQRAAD
eukprot:gnl/MRDRNA2_/MRDRNA2_182724_c0_seq1.p1 gnl/MRDRNA2_/MRDRNA2_182724_c0~~gnl/MRDRNA2_/MRDRNA2_182724_c0_seq1.p1  ORF type:complete len:102 (+),score=6.12 gnl/MRDRNA2_/MRDRNA2_182724_c0_seq1:373-678(+)